MCSIETSLCQSLVEEFFGSIVADIAYYLCQNGYQPLKVITNKTNYKLNQVIKLMYLY